MPLVIIMFITDIKDLFFLLLYMKTTQKFLFLFIFLFYYVYVRYTSKYSL